MRLLSFAVATLLVIAAAGCKESMPPAPASVITNTRDRLNPFRFTLTTDPASPTANSRVLLKVHVIDAADQPADGVDVQADLSMPGTGTGQHVALSGRAGGDYEGEVTPEMAGSWDVDLTATKDGKSKKQRFNIEVSG
jgi:YtkA-like protein